MDLHGIGLLSRIIIARFINLQINIKYIAREPKNNNNNNSGNEEKKKITTYSPSSAKLEYYNINMNRILNYF